MSEYIEIETEMSDDGEEILIYTNLALTEGGVEEYDSVAEMEEGSPVAQALAVVAGIGRLRMEENELIVIPEPGADWHIIVEDISAALKDFFL